MLTVGISAALAVIASSIDPAQVSAAPRLPRGCLAMPPYDSITFIDLFRDIVSDSEGVFRASADLPHLPADSVTFAGTAPLCDSAMAGYRAYRAFERGDSMPSLQMALLRVGRTRFVGDPHVATSRNLREWVIFDGDLKVIKIYRTAH